MAHLAISDELALECVRTDRVPKAMEKGLEAMLAGPDALAAYERSMIDRGRVLAPEKVHEWWRSGNAALCADLRVTDPSRRLPWGPNRMSANSFVTARLMETWAHGLDCFDAAGVTPVETDRLRHVAELSLRALPYAFMINGREAPGPVRLELTSPSGETWHFGPDDAPTQVTGTASDWCRVAVHRDRRNERSRLRGEGRDAADVLRIVQAYL